MNIILQDHINSIKINKRMVNIKIILYLKFNSNICIECHYETISNS